MYTMLMMMAVSSGGEASAFGGRNKGGCQGDYAGCTGYVAAAPASCNSCGGGSSRGGFLGGLCHKNKNSCQGGNACYSAPVCAPACAPAPVCAPVDTCGCQGGSGRGGFLAGLCKKKNNNNCCGSVVSYAPVATGCCGGMVAPTPAVVMPPMGTTPAPMPTPTPKPKTME